MTLIVGIISLFLNRGYEVLRNKKYKIGDIKHIGSFKSTSSDLRYVLLISNLILLPVFLLVSIVIFHNVIVASTIFILVASFMNRSMYKSQKKTIEFYKSQQLPLCVSLLKDRITIERLGVDANTMETIFYSDINYIIFWNEVDTETSSKAVVYKSFSVQFFNSDNNNFSTLDLLQFTKRNKLEKALLKNCKLLEETV